MQREGTKTTPDGLVNAVVLVRGTEVYAVRLDWTWLPTRSRVQDSTSVLCTVPGFDSSGGSLEGESSSVSKTAMELLVPKGYCDSCSVLVRRAAEENIEPED